MTAEPSGSVRELGSRGGVTMASRYVVIVGGGGSDRSYVDCGSMRAGRPHAAEPHRNNSPAPRKDAGTDVPTKGALHDRVGLPGQVGRAHQSRLVAQLGGDDIRHRAPVAAHQPALVRLADRVEDQFALVRETATDDERGGVEQGGEVGEAAPAQRASSR
ncbi:hypothetical protein SALBM311S_01900 [Streptomyces alboniger]